MPARSAADSDCNAEVPGFGMVGSNKTRHRHDQGLRGAVGPGEPTNLRSRDPDSKRSAGLLVRRRLNDGEAELLEQAARIERGVPD